MQPCRPNTMWMGKGDACFVEIGEKGKAKEVILHIRVLTATSGKDFSTADALPTKDSINATFIVVVGSFSLVRGFYFLFFMSRDT